MVPNICIALVVLACAVILPLWLYFDPVFVKELDIIAALSTSSPENEGRPVSNEKYKLFTKEELAVYGSNVEGDKVYLAMLGSVFDVTKGKKHYGRGGGYSFFSGRDGTRAFITGEFNEEGLTDDIRGLRSEDCFSLSGWLTFYEKDYKYVGKVIGNFYDEKGKETDELQRFWKEVVKAKAIHANEDAVKKIFPDCNSRWSQNAEPIVWCTTESGGVNRDWTGVPRKFFTLGQSDYRCACVKEDNLNDARIKNYPNCDSKAIQCTIKEDS